MTTLDIGSALRRQPAASTGDLGVLQGLLDSMRGSIADDVREAVLTEVTTLVTRVLNERAAAPSQVSVAAPQVTFQPVINVPDFPEIEPSEVTVTLGGMEALASQLTRIEGLLTALLQSMTKPVVREVQRGHDNLITSITERR